ncbi:sodium-independent sulfate anion transporter-like isoform X2 [Perognathus longimembris pacificus]|uniref:sodium-independent sulfate anion transporter-like isoform X2 n=1 Tax=Perognathus longimembris pacificus TaxID=214514 RepID=UPI002019D071|nr:sodium-independent sulfate anion transporter-like isoform X2 [Perognathus longimembris pacificus]
MLRVFLPGHLPRRDPGPHGHHVPAGVLLHLPRARLRRAAGLPVWLHPAGHGLPPPGPSGATSPRSPPLEPGSPLGLLSFPSWPPGFLLDFVSCPVIKGFTSAAAVTIGVGQVKNLLGLRDIPRQFFLQVYHIFLRIGDTRVGDAVLGLACMALLLSLKLMRNRTPPARPGMPLGVRLSLGLVWTVTTARNALVVSFAALMAYSFEVTGSQPFVLTGHTAGGLPPVQLPPFSVTTANGTVSFAEMVQGMGAGLAVVPLVGLLESVAVAKAFASQSSYRIDTNQELLAIGEPPAGWASSSL